MWWKWLIFALAIIILPLGILYFSEYVKKKENLTKEQEKTIRLNVAKYCLFYWLCDLFYMSFLIDNIPCKYVFGSLILLMTFYNLTMSFVSSTTKDALQRIGILQDFIVGVALTIYLIYLIPGKQIQINGVVTMDNSLRDIVTTVVAAIYGGLLSLVGVAWTIRKTDKDRKEDLRRLEDERKEEERRKYSPVFGVVNKNIDMQKCVSLLLDEIENIDRIVTRNENKKSIKLQPIQIENSSKIEFYVYGILFNNEFYATPEKNLIKKDYYLQIYFYLGARFTRNYEISLCIEDLIENRYKVKLNSEIKNNEIRVIGTGRLQVIGEKNE